MNLLQLRFCVIIIAVFIFHTFFGCSYNKKVLIDTSPPNSKVYIDGIEKGQTPYEHKFSFKDKSEYEISLQKEGFKEKKTIITYQPKNKSIYKIKLDKILKNIHVESYPSNSNAILNGSFIGQTPLTEEVNFKNINEIINLKIQKGGYHDGNIKIAYSTNKNDYYIQLLAKPKKIKYKRIENANYLPIYDINNVPISVWILKEGTYNSGFIVAGHAEKAVCKVASVEVMTKLNQLGFNNDNLISFGIGYDIRSRLTDKWTQSYHEKISELENKLTELSIKHPNQVKVNIISYNQYYNTIKLIEKHIKNASKSEYQNLIVEYKYNKSPLIIPFHYIESQKIVNFKVKKSLFGKIPRGLALNSMVNIIKEAQKEINNILSHNKKEKKKLKQMYTKYTT